MNPHHIPKNHPVRVVLEGVTNGHGLPTKAFLDRTLLRDDLPEGSDLNRLRPLVARAAAEVNKIMKTGGHAQAREKSQWYWGELAAAMTESERALDSAEANPESVDDITRRMFTR